MASRNISVGFVCGRRSRLGRVIAESEMGWCLATLTAAFRFPSEETRLRVGQIDIKLTNFDY